MGKKNVVGVDGRELRLPVWTGSRKRGLKKLVRHQWFLMNNSFSEYRSKKQLSADTSVESKSASAEPLNRKA
jgi:hypothetical protein